MDKKTYTKFIKLAVTCQSFYYASQLLWDDYVKAKSVEKYLPYIVNTAFTSELALKALLVKCQCGFKKGHKIYELFLQLPDEVKNCIITALKIYYSAQEISWLVDQIKLVSDYFYKVRYISDFTVIIDISFCKNLMETIFLIEQRLCGKYEISPVSDKLSLDKEKLINEKFNATYCNMIKEAAVSASKLLVKTKL